MGFLKQAVKGVSWMGGLRVISRVATIGKTIILARILTPTDFGLFGIVTLTIALLETFTETGINAVLIQLQEKVEDFIDTAWVISIIRGGLIAGLMLVFAQFLVKFFSAPSALPLLLLAAVVPFIRGFINPASVIFQKELYFGKEFLLRSASLLADTLFSVIFVLMTGSVIGLVWGIIVGVIVELFLSYLMLPLRPALIFKKEKFLKIINFGKWLTVNGILSYFADQIDNIFVGKFLGVTSLGIYQMAYKLANISFSEITDVSSKVTFPVYSKISGDRLRLKKAYLKTLFVITIFSFIASAVLFLFPELLIKILLGDRWLAAALPLRILAIFGFIRAVSSSAAPLFLAVGKPNLMAQISGIKILILLLLLPLLTINFGLIGAGLAVVSASLFIQPIVWINVMKILL